MRLGVSLNVTGKKIDLFEEFNNEAVEWKIKLTAYCLITQITD